MQQTEEKPLIFEDVFSGIDLSDLSDRQKDQAKKIWTHATAQDDKSARKKVEHYIRVCLFFKTFPEIKTLNISVFQKDMALTLWCNAEKNENAIKIVETYLAQAQGIRKITQEPVNQANILAQLPTNEREALTVREIAEKANLGIYVCQDTLRYLVTNKQAIKIKSRRRPSGEYSASRFWRSENLVFEDILAVKEQEILEYIKESSPKKDELFLQYKRILSEQLVRQIAKKLHSEGKIGDRWDQKKEGYTWVYRMPDLTRDQYNENIVLAIIGQYGQVTETSLSRIIGKNRTAAGNILRKMRDERKLKVRLVGQQKVYESIT
ncbi:MAG: hypothetical protein ACRCYP_01180 [Alphaproteobacteria bacterium]